MDYAAAKAMGAQAGAPADAQADLSLMLAFLRDVWKGEECPPGFAERLVELKKRGLVRQVPPHGRAAPTPPGEILWNHAKDLLARETLGERRIGSRRPYFVVFDGERKPYGFKDWDRAVEFAGRCLSESPGAFAAVGTPEDLVEIWERSLLSPDAIEKVDRHGVAIVS